MINNKNLILVTDGIPSANGGGISQTLYNLFSEFPWHLSIIVHHQEEKLKTTELLKGKTIIFRMAKFGLMKNRFGRLLNPYIQKLNHWWLDKTTVFPLQEWPGAENSIILVSTTDPFKIHFVSRLNKLFGYRVVPYFMDDWLDELVLSWPGNNIHRVAKRVLEEATAWMMISPQLENILKQRYQLPDKPCLVVHNPVSINNSQLKDDSEDGLIIYAGSVWPMHLDALQLVADAVSLLHTSYDKRFRLLIYTGEPFWQTNKHSLEKPGVNYGGFIAYDQLQSYLSKAWLLLVTASFENRYRAFTLSSVQTKLTDYMAAGRPILYVGPSDGASGQFVQQWQCGYTFSGTNSMELAEYFKIVITEKDSLNKMGENGQWAIKEKFNKHHIRKELYGFLEACF